MIHVLASIKVKPGKRDILLEHLKSNIPNVIKEKGCIEYNSTIDVDYQMDNQTFDENMVTIIEKHFKRSVIKPGTNPKICIWILYGFIYFRGDFTRRLPECEELVRVTHRE